VIGFGLDGAGTDGLTSGACNEDGEDTPLSVRVDVRADPG
jgi:hypothetical protein